MLMILALASGCVYYNTFYNARKAFSQAEKARKDTRKNKRIDSGNYRIAIEKSLKVIENHPNSKYYDDALYVLMISYYYTDQFAKSERRAREILAEYGESEFAREANLYMAKAKLMQKDVAEAIPLFQEIFDGDYDDMFKSEAAMTLGMYYRENKEYNKAEPYFRSLRDSLGNDAQKRLAQVYLADGYYDAYRFEDALGAYLQILGMNPDKEEKYHALFRAADCSYRLQRIADGQDYLSTLMKEDVYFDSLPSLKLMMGEGYELDEALPQAEAVYQEIIYETERGPALAEAYWRLGLIYQYDYDDLLQAKVYYDSTSKKDRGDIGQAALQQSSAIGLLAQYSESSELDSTATQDMIDQAAYTQYRLAELYWMDLNKPDSGIIAMQTVIDSFPTAYDTPKAMIALSEMIREYKEDSVAADSILDEVLVKYPRSDFVGEVLEMRGLIGTEADTGYAGAYLRKAEYYLVDDFNPDSARAMYQIIVDRFEDSRYYEQARFALIWLTEMYESPGDSSVIWAYTEFADSFSGSGWANVARSRLKYTPGKPSRNLEDKTLDSTMLAEGDVIDSVAEEPSTVEYASADMKARTDDEGNVLPQLIYDPIRVVVPFEYPPEAYRDRWYGELIFHVMLDPFGEVEWYELRTHSPRPEIDERAKETFESMTWDMTRFRRLDPQGLKMYYVFKVELPDHLK